MESTDLQQKTDNEYWGMDENSFCMLMHLSQFAGYIVPLAGIILPIIMWSTNKDTSSMIDKQGKIILNWMLTSIILIAIGFILALLFIGIFVIIAVVVMSIIFAVLGAIKASKGEVYQYPFSIKFIK